MSRKEIEDNLRKNKDEYIRFYHQMEATTEFKDLSRSARGTGMFFQYHQSVRDAIVERAKEAGKLLRRGIYDKAKETNPELIENLQATMSAAEKYLKKSTETYTDTEELRKMLRTLKDTYLPET